MPFPLLGLAILGGISGGASIAGSVIGSRAAGKAANVQSEAADRATQAQTALGREALDLQREQFETQQENIRPFLEVGEENLIRLSDLVSPGGELDERFSFDFEADPGFAFLLEEGQKALDRSAAARGGLRSGRAVKEGQRFATGLASQEFDRSFRRAFDVFRAGQTDRFNRIASLAGVGQQAAGQLASVGSNFANQGGNVLLNLADVTGRGITDAAAARASGFIGSANAFNQGLGGVGNTATDLFLLNRLLPGGSSNLASAAGLARNQGRIF